MKYIIFVSLVFLTLSSCGRRGTLEKPSGEGEYPKQYPHK
jgi:predicted small lipoprotein YifL